MSRPVLIVGAGAAGLSAAAELAEAGVPTTLVDENPRAGGVVYRGTAREGHDDHSLGKLTVQKIAHYRALRERHRDKMTIRTGCQVVGAFGEGRLAVLQDGVLEQLEWDHAIACTGCYERSVPFPGWTLPGVMTVGGAQLQVKGGLVRPAQRMVLCGTGPLLPVAARQLHHAGVEILGVFEAARRRELFAGALGLWRQPELLQEGLSCMTYLARNKVPFRFGRGILNAEGDPRLQRVTVARYGTDGTPDRSRTEIFEVDGLGVSYGFVPRTQLTELLGAKHVARDGGGYRVEHDVFGRSSRPNVYVAGDGAEVFGSEAAAIQGRLAAMGCLRDAGMFDDAELQRRSASLRRRLSTVQSVSRRMFAACTHRPGMLDLAAVETTVCRCEGVRLRDIDTVIERGVRDLTTLKMATRIGMGDCQGKVCGDFCRDYLARKVDGDVGRLRPRFPLAPVPFGALTEDYSGEA